MQQQLDRLQLQVRFTHPKNSNNSNNLIAQQLEFRKRYKCSSLRLTKRTPLCARSETRSRSSWFLGNIMHLNKLYFKMNDLSLPLSRFLSLSYSLPRSHFLSLVPLFLSLTVPLSTTTITAPTNYCYFCFFYYYYYYYYYY